MVVYVESGFLSDSILKGHYVIKFILCSRAWGRPTFQPFNHRLKLKVLDAESISLILTTSVIY